MVVFCMFFKYLFHFFSSNSRTYKYIIGLLFISQFIYSPGKSNNLTLPSPESLKFFMVEDADKMFKGGYLDMSRESSTCLTTLPKVQW